MITVRCSALPRIFACPASAKKPEVKIDTSGEIATTGTAAHEAYATMATGGVPDCDAIEAKYGLEAGDVHRLYYQGLNVWELFSGRVEVVAVEKQLATLIQPGIELTGSSDVVGHMRGDPETGVIVDWKTGYREGDALRQLQGYAYLAASTILPEAKRWKLVTVWTRLGTSDTVECDGEDIDEAACGLADLMTYGQEDPAYSPSEQNCIYCPLSIDCPARRALLSGAANDMIAMTGDDSGGEITPARLGGLYQQSRMLKRALEAYEKALRDAVWNAPGQAIECEGGTVALKESQRCTIGWAPEILAKHIPQSAVDDLRPTVGKTELEKAVADHSARGQKAKAKIAVMEELREEGYVEEKTVRSLEFRKA